MIFIYGSRKAQIKKYKDFRNPCRVCGHKELEVSAKSEYYHLFYIPILPLGNKILRISCANCGESFNSDNPDHKYGEIRNPIYLWTGSLLIASLLGSLLVVNIWSQKEKKRLISSPEVGDVYTIETENNGKNSYHFLKIHSINQDSVFMFHNRFEYLNYISNFDNEDYFVADEILGYSKGELISMLDSSVIISIERNYKSGNRFNIEK